MAPEVSVRNLSQLANNLPDDQFEQVIKLAAGYITSRRISKQAFLQLKRVNNIPSRDFGLLFVAVIKLIRKGFAVDISQGDHAALDKFINELRFTQSKSQVFYDIFLHPESGSKLIKYVEPSPPIVIKVEWRLDVIILSSDTSEEMKPVIELQFTTTKGVYCCQLTLETFHDLRLAVAASLKDVYLIGSRNK